MQPHKLLFFHHTLPLYDLFCLSLFFFFFFVKPWFFSSLSSIFFFFGSSISYRLSPSICEQPCLPLAIIFFLFWIFSWQTLFEVAQRNALEVRLHFARTVKQFRSAHVNNKSSYCCFFTTPSTFLFFQKKTPHTLIFFKKIKKTLASLFLISFMTLSP